MTFSTPDLCDEYAQQLQIAEPLFQCYGAPTRFAGTIATLKCFEDNSLVREAVAESGNGRVLVVDGGGSLRRSLLGDQLAAKAVANGWQGIIINGCLRDVDDINTMELGVRALACHPCKTDKRGEGQRDITVHFAGVLWAPGGYVYADNNGIVLAQKKLT
jgi:regulator of ribonuclease activity A